ncbi:hypothetical protein Acr_11g0011280 [Actinidia rufa]|uniref:Uncharacterized protein n=1 Tax=Actinidia rufa TaxID=165716 RepID=A0A7J0FDP6_9ERIC|nr:hypothetical protein Acr_11g0011280 [Actinidia rufa]
MTPCKILRDVPYGGAGRNVAARCDRALEILVVNYQCEKKHLNDLKKAKKKVTVLEGELRKKEDELVVTVDELKKKDGVTDVLHQVAHDLVYQSVYDHGWNKADDLYVCDAIKDRAEAFHESWHA